MRERGGRAPASWDRAALGVALEERYADVGVAECEVAPLQLSAERCSYWNTQDVGLKQLGRVRARNKARFNNFRIGRPGRRVRVTLVHKERAIDHVQAATLIEGLAHVRELPNHDRK